MNYAALKREIETDPLGRGYAGMTDQQIADSLNTTDRTTIVPTVVGALGIMRLVGPMMGASILDKIEAAAASDSRLKWFLRELTTNGIDLGHPVTRATIDELAVAGVITGAEAAALNQAAERTVTRAEELGLGTYPVSAQMVATAKGGSY